MAISQYHVGYHESSGENVTAFPRLHPKGTSSRFALRAPRPLWGLAMTNLEALRQIICAARFASAQGARYPQGARRIRKAAKPPTAAQGTPLQTQLVRAILTIAGSNRQCAAGRKVPSQ